MAKSRVCVWFGVVGILCLGGCGGAKEGGNETPKEKEQASAAHSIPAPVAVGQAPVATRIADPAPPAAVPDGLFLPDDDANNSGPTLLGMPVEIEGEVSTSAKGELGIRTADDKIYVVDDGASKLQQTESPVRVVGTPYVEDGVLRITADAIETIRR